MKPKLIFLIGPTAIGKTDIAIMLAKKINAEIISCDSMQIYKGMDIITSQPTAGLRKKMAHHLIGIIPLTKEYNVLKYRKAALKKIREIINRGKIPLLVGGTGLYISILIDGIFNFKSKGDNVRQRLYKQAEILGSQCLYKRLADVDPEAAIKVHPHDVKRIVRALEVFEITGKQISKLQKQKRGLTDRYEMRIFGLNMQRHKLYRRIDARVEKMFMQGLVGEVRKLLKQKLSRTASCAIGIKELKGYFAGEYDLEEAKRLMKRNTRLYAKRQLTWFRKDKRIEWIELGEREKPKEIARRIVKKLAVSVINN